jgi:hypothetical protein
MPQFGNICSIEYVIKAGLCPRLCRSVNIIASKNPVRAPRNDSVIERLLKVGRPWPVRINPVYAIATVQTIARAFTTYTSEILSIVTKILVPWKIPLRARERLYGECVVTPYSTRSSI